MGKISWHDLQGSNQYDRWAFYSQSKLANVMFALEFGNKAIDQDKNDIHAYFHRGLANYYIFKEARQRGKGKDNLKFEDDAIKDFEKALELGDEESAEFIRTHT